MIQHNPSRRPLRPRRFPLMLGLALAVGGCTVVDGPRSAGYAAPPAPVYATQGYAAPAYGAPVYRTTPYGTVPASPYAAGSTAYAAPSYGGGGPGLPRGADPYCREARREARAASREAAATAQAAQREAWAGAPGWAQAENARAARDTAAEAERARYFAARDC